MDVTDVVLKEHSDWLEKVQNLLNTYEYSKMNTEDANKKEEKMDLELEYLREKSETCENHFAMVENFVEKYIPIRIQSQISETMNVIVPKDTKKKLEAFEHERFSTMHQTILEDDGVPHLYKHLRRIHMDINKIYNPSYAGPKAAKHARHNIINKIKN